MVQLLAEYVVVQVRMSVNIKKVFLGVRSSCLAILRFHWTIGSFKVTECLERVPNISWNYVQSTLCFCKHWYNSCQTMGKIRAFCIPYMQLLRTKAVVCTSKQIIKLEWLISISGLTTYWVRSKHQQKHALFRYFQNGSSVQKTLFTRTIVPSLTCARYAVNFVLLMV